MGVLVLVTQVYRYRAARSDGSIVSGLVEAATGAEASSTLIERGLHPLEFRAAEPEEAQRRPAPRRELAIVFRSIAALVAAGVPLDRAVASSENLARGPLRECLVRVRERLRGGASLSQALETGHGVVPALTIGMLRAGERGSDLETALEHVASQLEQEADLIARVRQALAYPLLLLVAGFASVFIIATTVIPKFAEMLGDLGQALPPATRALLAVSDVVTRFWLPLLIVVLALVCSVWQWSRSGSGRLACHRLLLALPQVGSVRHALATARFGRALGSMLATGMPILAALEAGREATGDAAVAERLAQARERVAQGQPLATALQAERAVTTSAVQLIAVGEASGKLAPMASRAGDLTGQEAERALRTVVALLEPALVVLLGGLVAFVAGALLQAVYSIRPGAT
jgi:general secretion pathway protein F